MNKTIFNRIAFYAMLVGFIELTSCNKNDEPTPTPQEVQQHFVFINQIDQKTNYLGTFSDLSQKELNNKNTYEFGFGTYPFVYGNIVLIAEGVWGDKIHQFTRDTKGYLVKGQTMTFGQDSRPGEIAFFNNETAYVSLSKRGKIGIFNPQTMQQKGEIDLAKYATNDNNPDPGCNVIRDGKLYVSLNQKNSPHTSWPGTGAEVAIIDLKTNTVEKVIKDNRTASVGLFRHSSAIKDEHGDIYFYSIGMDGMNPLKDGFLRIKKGTDEWDKDYYFQLSKTKVTGIDTDAAYILPFYYAGGGIVYACINIPAYTQHNDPMQSSILDFNYQPVKINLWNKTIEKLNLPLTTSMGAFACTRYKDFIVFGMTCKEGTGYYTYNTKTGECSQRPVVTTIGVPSSLVAIE